MSLNRWTILALLMVASGLPGCATPPAIPAAPTPADIIKAIPQGNNTTVVNVQPQSHHQTLPDFLGITRCCYYAINCCNTARTQAANCFPGLADVIEPGAGVLGPGDVPSDLAGGPVGVAAEIKAAEASAEAKIAALRYLAGIGCGVCGHPPYTEVEGAFVAALDDCIEAVRYEALLALRKTTCGKHKHHCQACGGKACCSEKIQKKLRELAYETDDDGCPKEPSERVRRMARLVLRACGPAPIEPTEPAEEQRELEAPREAPPQPVAPPESGEGPPAETAPPTGSVPPPVPPQ